MMEKIETLLPCPFCGEDGKLFEGDFGVYVVNCLNDTCYCRQKASWRTGAIDKWNTRTTPAPSNTTEQACEIADRLTSDSYTDGVRDLADMDHVSPVIANVLRDCARLIDELRQPPSDAMREALERAKVLIGAKNDGLSEAARQSNINEAWHILDAALTQEKPDV